MTEARCPSCGFFGSLETFIDDDSGKALAQALSLSPIGSALLKYLGLFRPSERKLTMSRANKLLTELVPQITAQRIMRNGHVVDVPLAVWEIALEKMLVLRDTGKLSLPLKSHGYLYEILVSEAAQTSHAQVIKADRQPLVSTLAKSSGTALAVNALEQRKQRQQGGF